MMKDYLISPETLNLKLAPCPFCGDEDPEFIATEEPLADPTDVQVVYDIWCPRCFKRIRPHYCVDPILAAGEWNERNRQGRTIDPERVMEDFERKQWKADENL